AQLDAGALREQAQGAGEVQVLLAGDEGDDVAAGGAGAEAVPALAVRIDVEGRRLLRVEGAVGLEVTPGLLQSHALADDVDDVELGFDLVNGAHGWRTPGRARATPGRCCPE